MERGARQGGKGSARVWAVVNRCSEGCRHCGMKALWHEGIVVLSLNEGVGMETKQGN